MTHRRLLVSVLIVGLLLPIRPAAAQAISNPELFEKSLRVAAEAAVQYGVYDNQAELARRRHLGTYEGKASFQTKFAGYEGRCFVVSACQYQPPPGSAVPDWPLDRPLIRGGSVIVSPMVEVAAVPVYNREELLIATIDRDDVVRGRYDLDVVGHYARPDVFTLTVDEGAA